jgi:uncharacterized protein YbjT (DUF2867 family)
MLEVVEAQQDSIVVTGANGQLGRALLRELARRSRPNTRALVRSQRASNTIQGLQLTPAPEIRIVDYTNPLEMEEAIQGTRCVVHLVGIIKETPDTRYEQAHEQTCEALAQAAGRAGVERIVYLSILGSSPDSENACLSSKGRAGEILRSGPVPCTILRVPMVLGGDDPASASLRAQARARTLRLVNGGRSLQQPIDARDLIRAILAAVETPEEHDLVFDAGGPTCLEHRELVLRAARLWDNEPRIRSLPIYAARLGVAALAAILPRPPITPAMFDILQHDDRADPEVFCQALGIELTPLDTTLADLVGPESEPDT